MKRIDVEDIGELKQFLNEVSAFISEHEDRNCAIHEFLDYFSKPALETLHSNLHKIDFKFGDLGVEDIDTDRKWIELKTPYGKTKDVSIEDLKKMLSEVFEGGDYTLELGIDIWDDEITLTVTNAGLQGGLQGRFVEGCRLKGEKEENYEWIEVMTVTKGAGWPVEIGAYNSYLSIRIIEKLAEKLHLSLKPISCKIKN